METVTNIVIVEGGIALALWILDWLMGHLNK